MDTASTSRDPRTEQARELMLRFADRTGLHGSHAPRRYLWTDAFAVCNFLGLAHRTGSARYSELATELVEQVHHVLGRHRSDDSRWGWISGLDDASARRHPTTGGLRIGKLLPERPVGKPMDLPREGARDGQYFHYLTKWMLALERFARSTGGEQPLVWARELAHTAHRGFTSGPPGARRMIWKASIDLSRPLVDTMGQHDPLDGLVTCLSLDAAATELGAPKVPPLAAAITDYLAMLDPAAMATVDPLGLGGLLVDAFRLARLPAIPDDLLAIVLEAAAIGVEAYAELGEPTQPLSHRLAFRELGLVIGFAALATLDRDALSVRALAACSRIHRYTQLRAALESFWLRPEHRATRIWSEHEDINDVMLATCLCPEGLLEPLHPTVMTARRST